MDLLADVASPWLLQVYVLDALGLMAPMALGAHGPRGARPLMQSRSVATPKNSFLKTDEPDSATALEGALLRGMAGENYWVRRSVAEAVGRGVG